VVYKVISKILVVRLSCALQDIIGPAHNNFLGGRNTIGNINLAQDFLRHYSRKKTSPLCLIKVDFRKAFDSMQWLFLRELLHLLGFPQCFVHLVMLCVETSSFSVAINGSLYGFFLGKCVVIQGDLFSPYLFLVCMEYLSRMLKITSQQPDFHYHLKCAFHHICHLAFVDDILLLCRGNRLSIRILLEQLHIFGHASGLHINAGKSSMYFGGVGVSIKQGILQDSCFSEAASPSNTLVSPSVPQASY